MYYIKPETPCLTSFPNTEKRVENTTHSVVFLTNLEVFGNVVKHRPSVFYIFPIETKTKEKTEKKNL